MDNKNKLSSEELRKGVKTMISGIMKNIDEGDGRCMFLLVDDGDGITHALAGDTRNIAKALLKFYIRDEATRRMLSAVAKTIMTFELLGPDGAQKLVSEIEANVAASKMSYNNTKAEA